MLISLVIALFSFGQLPAQGQELELDSRCKWAPLWWSVKCDYPNEGPYGFRVGMNSVEVKDTLIEIFEGSEINRISAAKVLGPHGGTIPGYLRDDEKLEENILWADNFVLHLRRFGRDGIVIYDLEDGSIVKITWEWGIDLP